MLSVLYSIFKILENRNIAIYLCTDKVQYCLQRVMPASRHHPGPGGVGGLRQDVPLQRAAQLQLPPEREERLQRRVAAVQVEPVQGGVALRGPGHPPRRDVRADLLQRGGGHRSYKTF